MGVVNLNTGKRGFKAASGPPAHSCNNENKRSGSMRCWMIKLTHCTIMKDSRFMKITIKGTKEKGLLDTVKRRKNTYGSNQFDHERNCYNSGNSKILIVNWNLRSPSSINNVEPSHLIPYLSPGDLLILISKPQKY